MDMPKTLGVLAMCAQVSRLVSLLSRHLDCLLCRLTDAGTGINMYTICGYV